MPWMFYNATGVAKTGEYVGSEFPVGTVVPTAASSAASGWVLCDGSSLVRADYPDLFSAIGTTYGSASGTTFNVPDLRGRVPAGKDNMGGTAASRLTTAGAGVNGASLGATGGTETHTLTTAQLPAHSHGVTDPGHYHGTVGARNTNGGFGVTNLSNGDVNYNTNTTSNGTGISIQNTGSGNAHPNAQPTLVLNYIIYAVPFAKRMALSAGGSAGDAADSSYALFIGGV